jgi:hypothetical protein
MQAKRRALDEIGARQRAADEKRREATQQQSRLERTPSQHWFNNAPEDLLGCWRPESSGALGSREAV